jgi:hypothetical protein
VKQRVVSGLFVCCLLFVQGQRPMMGRAASSQTGQKPRPTEGTVPRWETVRAGPRSDAKVLRVWQYDVPDDDHRIALVILSDADFQQFVIHPDEFLNFLNRNDVFKRGDPVQEVVHWTSVLRASKQKCCGLRAQGNKPGAGDTKPEDPDPWLLTITHAKPCRATVTSQPLEQAPSQ